MSRSLPGEDRRAGPGRYFADSSLEDKVRKAQEPKVAIADPGKKMAFVGNGINEVPVIARADAVVATGDSAIEGAGVMIVGGVLSGLGGTRPGGTRIGWPAGARNDSTRGRTLTAPTCGGQEETSSGGIVCATVCSAGTRGSARLR
ncbi:MAG: hypothetical protein AB1497_09785 [Bacillota bacterium]